MDSENKQPKKKKYVSPEDLEVQGILRVAEQAQEDRRYYRIMITSIVVTVIATLILAYLKFDVYRWWILGISFVSSLATLLLLDDKEKLNETTYFIKTWLALALVTCLSSFVTYIVLVFIYNVIFQ